jgi:hypothetical protein
LIEIKKMNKEKNYPKNKPNKMKIKLLKIEKLITFDCQTLIQLIELMKVFEYIK